MLTSGEKIVSGSDGRRLRVAIISDAVSGRNGVGTFYEDLAAHLAPRVERVQLIAPSDVERRPHQSYSFPIPGDATQRLYWPKRGRLVRLLREIDPHVAVFPTIGPYTYFGCREIRRMKRPLFVVQHTDFEKLAELYFHPLLAAACRPVLRWLTRGALRRAERVGTNNPQTAQSLQRQGVPNVRVLGTPIAAEFIRRPPPPLGGELREVLFLGRLAPEKNIEQVIQAARDLPALHFRIAGDGPLRPQIERQCRGMPNLRYLGWLDRAAVVAALDQSDLLLLPSSVESFGTVALEALSRGRLVLVSRQCGIRNWPRLAECLYYSEPHEGLTEAIRRVAALDSGARGAMSARGRRAALDANDAAVDGWLSNLLELAPPASESLVRRPKRMARRPSGVAS